MLNPEFEKIPAIQAMAVIERVVLSPQLTLIRFSKNIKAAQPGQYVMIGLPHFDEKPFMVFNTNPLEIIVQSKGPFTQLITSSESKYTFAVRGPFGTGFTFPKDIERSCSLLINTVAGLSAELFLLQQLQENGHKNIQLFVSSAFMGIARQLVDAKSQIFEYQEAAVLEVIKSLQIQTEYLYFSATTDHVIAALQNLLPDDSISEQTLVSAQGLFTQFYTACAVGICGRCAENGFLTGKLPCHEGPVFDVLNL